MKRMTGDEDFQLPIILLFLFSMFFAFEVTHISRIIGNGPIRSPEPLLFASNLFETIGGLFWLCLPIAIIVFAVKQKNMALKLTYFLSSIPLLLEIPWVSTIASTRLHAIKTLLIFAVIISLVRYLINTTELYKKALKGIKEPDNK